MEIRNPSNEELIEDIEADNEKSIEKKYQSSLMAYNSWKNLDIKSRVLILQKFCHLLEENIEELAFTLTSEMGKPLQESRNEINGAIKKMEFFIKESEKHLETREVNTDGNTKELISYEPLGVVANISAWNYPYLVGVNTFISALVCGNTVLYKPSEFTTLTGLKIEKYLLEAGLPESVFQVIIGNKEAGECLLNLPLDGYFFTGSYATGKTIHEKVSSKLVPVGLELGGKDPLYVTDEVEDISNTALAAVEGAFYNNGQSCCAVERIYVQESIYKSFVEEFKKHIATLKVGDPLDEKNSQGPLARKDQINFLNDQINDAVSKGAEISFGGKKIESKGYYFEPTLLINVSHEMRVMKEESFGPIIGVMKVEDDNEAIKLMNDTDYGLTASVYSSNQKRAEQIISKLNVGTGYINCCDRVSGYLPWSGRKKSGLGSTLSHLGIYAFCQPKALQFRSI